MYLMYVDETGDPGAPPLSPTNFFGLTGLVIPVSEWSSFLQAHVGFRRIVKSRYGLNTKEEVHASVLMGRVKPPFNTIPKASRLAILREYLDFLNSIGYLRIINVFLPKSLYPTPDIFNIAWTRLIQRYENGLVHNSFPKPTGSSTPRGLIISDETNHVSVQKLLRRMRAYNPIPNVGRAGKTQRPLQRIVEDAFYKNSRDSYLIQSADVVAYFLKQHFQPSSYMSKKGGKNYLSRLSNVLYTKASSSNPLGIVTR